MVATLKLWSLVVLATACGACTSPLTPSPVVHHLETVSLNLAELAPPPRVGTCKWRNAEVRVLIDAGRPVPNIFVLSDGVHRVYLDWVSRDPSSTWYWFGVEDIPGPWCTIF